MDYAEALKKVAGMKPRDTYMMIQFGYSTKLVLSHANGVAFLNSLTCAEQLTEEWNKPPQLTGIKVDQIQVNLLSREDYERYKMAMLMSVTLDDLKTAEINYKQSTPQP